MRILLKRNGRTAEVETLGGELVSYRDEGGLEYIWQGDPAYWAGRNPLLFPVIGALKDGVVQVEGKPYQMERHGFARRRYFAPVEQGEDYLILELREDAESLAMYPFPFTLQVRHTLTECGFSTAITVENTGERTMPFCLGGHTAFRCPLRKGERFEDYDLVFPQREHCATLPPRGGYLDRLQAVPCLKDSDTLPLRYEDFDRMDTLVLEGLRSHTVALRHRESGRGLEMDFSDFPVLAFWTVPGRAAPYLCIEPWHGCPHIEGEGPELAHKAHAILLSPGARRTLEYRVATL